MSLLDRVLARPQASQLENPQYPLSGSGILEALRIPTLSSSAVRVTERTSLTMPAVWRAVNLLSGTVGALPLHPYKKVVVTEGGTDNGSQDGGSDWTVRQRVSSESAAAVLLDSPHPDLTAFELWEGVMAHLCLWGNAYLQMLRTESGGVRELWPIHPSRVLPGRAKDLSKVYVIDGNTDEPRFDNTILHIPGFGYDGVAGLSPIAAARNGIGLAMATEEFGGKLFANGSNAGGIITTEQRLKPEDAEALKARWKAKMSGLNHSHDVAIMDAGAKFEKLTIPPEDAQFLQTRSFQVEEIARLFGVPPHLLMSSEKSTSWGTGLEQNTLAFVIYTLRPYLTRIEQRVTKILRPAPVYAKYQIEGLLRGDATARASFYRTMFELGVLSTNEIRALEELPPVQDGDVRYRPLNMGKLGTFDAKNADASGEAEGLPAPAAPTA